MEFPVEVDAEPEEVIFYDRYPQNTGAPIMGLPVEILRTIFHLTQTPDRVRMPPRASVRGIGWSWRELHGWMRLRLVCGHWHDVVASTPSLWTDIFVHDSVLASTEAMMHWRAHGADTTRRFLSRSQQLPLKVYLGEFAEWGPQPPALRIVRAILEELPRIQELTMSVFCISRRAVLEAIQDTKLPMLRALASTVGYSDTEEPILLSGDGLPALRSLSIGYNQFVILSNFGNLKQLDLWGASGRPYHRLFDLFDSMSALKTSR